MGELIAMTVAEYGAPAFFSGYVDTQAREFGIHGLQAYLDVRTVFAG
jgi:hypothetical protein